MEEAVAGVPLAVSDGGTALGNLDAGLSLTEGFFHEEY